MIVCVCVFVYLFSCMYVCIFVCVCVLVCTCFDRMCVHIFESALFFFRPVYPLNSNFFLLSSHPSAYAGVLAIRSSFPPDFPLHHPGKGSLNVSPLR